LDIKLANACIDYLNYDRLAKAEVHTHLPDGGRQMEWFHCATPAAAAAAFVEHDDHEQRLYALAERLGREPDELLKQS